MSLARDREALAQVIHDSFYAMQAGEFPDPATREGPNAGDMQLASDIQEAGWTRPPMEVVAYAIYGRVSGNLKAITQDISDYVGYYDIVPLLAWGRGELENPNTELENNT